MAWKLNFNDIIISNGTNGGTRSQVRLFLYYLSIEIIKIHFSNFVLSRIVYIN